MPFVKVVKNKAYFKRFQVKYRRRREAKTDYQARVNLVRQDKNKYNSPKYRFVVRFTNRDVITQVVYSKICGDFVVASAYSHELAKYGVTLGLTNYASTYATGLLCARRLLSKYKLADKYAGNSKVDGTLYNVEALEEENAPRPFRALLDVGLRRTTTGNKVFAALKGFADGGVDIPHNEKRFPGYDSAEKKLNAETHKKHIFGGNVADFMKSLRADDEETYKAHFSRYIKAGVKPEDLEKIYKTAHDGIRKDPAHVKAVKKAKAPFKSYKRARLTLSQRRDRISQKINAKIAAAAKKA